MSCARSRSERSQGLRSSSNPSASMALAALIYMSYRRSWEGRSENGFQAVYDQVSRAGLSNSAAVRLAAVVPTQVTTLASSQMPAARSKRKGP